MNAFSNFNRDAATNRVNPETILQIFASKHWHCILDHVADLEIGVIRERGEPISRRVDDLIMYLVILSAMMEARDRREARAAMPPPQMFGTELGLTVVDQHNSDNPTVPPPRRRKKR